MLSNFSRVLPAMMLGLLLSGLAPSSASAAPLESDTGPVVTTLSEQNGKWQLLRGGEPYFIKGAGGNGSKEALKAAGANSFRTWGADDLHRQLDEAHKLGLTVTGGIWLGHKGQGFDYGNKKLVAEQTEKAKRFIDRNKNHPALLMWGIGNEMEMAFPDDSPEIWQIVEEIAAYAKQVDPHHPTMTVVAEIGGSKVSNINKYCPSIDIIGINSYGGGATVGERYVRVGGGKPYVVTEFGPAGTWELPKNSWGTVVEPTSTAKVKNYRATYEKSIASSPLSLGSYAFIWGNKQEASATWFGMLLGDGTRLEAVDALMEIWNGKPPANRVPKIESLKLGSEEVTTPGAIIKATVKVVDPENDPLKVEWVLQRDPMERPNGGAAEAIPPTYPEAIQSASSSEVTVKMPSAGGAYRLFAYIRDGQGGGAVGNLPLYVEGSEQPTAESRKPDFQAVKAQLPLQLLGAAEDVAPYVPSGYMGRTEAIKMSESTDNPHSGPSSLKVEYNARGDWGGVAWQSPANDWGDKPGGWDLRGVRKLTFWARGEKGGEAVSFSLGILGAGKKYPDSGKGESGTLTLTPQWEQYTIGLVGKDLSNIKTGFCWIVAGNAQPVTFYLDDIQFEK